MFALSDVFQTILRMNVSAMICAAVVLALKLLLNKLSAPRRITFCLWAVIAFRLVCPVSMPSQFSVYNVFGSFESTSVLKAVERVDAEIANYSVSAPIIQKNSLWEVSSSRGIPAKSANTDVLFWIWLAGATAVLSAGAVSARRLSAGLRFAVRRERGVYAASGIPTSFVFGVFSPKIYVPENADEESLPYILAHERAHIKRGDHITKIAAYIVLSLNWFNPLNWLLFRLFSNDMEFACDERALSALGVQRKREYSDALLKAAVRGGKGVIACGICFSANITKSRIKSMMKFKRRSPLAAALTLAACLIVSVSAATDASAVKGGAEDTRAAHEREEQSSENISADADELFGEEKGILEIEPASTYETQNDENAAAVEEKIAEIALADESEDAVETAQAGESAPRAEESEEADEACVSFDRVESVSASETAGGIVGNFSYKNGCYAEIDAVRPDADGTVGVYFELNADVNVSVTLFDTSTGMSYGVGVLACGGDAYRFSGLNPDAMYGIVLKSDAGKSWKIEG